MRVGKTGMCEECVPDVTITDGDGDVPSEHLG